MDSEPVESNEESFRSSQVDFVPLHLAITTIVILLFMITVAVLCH